MRNIGGPVGLLVGGGGSADRTKFRGIFVGTDVGLLIIFGHKEMRVDKPAPPPDMDADKPSPPPPYQPSNDDPGFLAAKALLGKGVKVGAAVVHST